MANTNRVSEPTHRPESLEANFNPLNEQIAQRAYRYWESRGREDGYDLEDWLKAEQDLGPRPAGGQPSAK